MSKGFDKRWWIIIAIVVLLIGAGIYVKSRGQVSYSPRKIIVIGGGLGDRCNSDADCTTGTCSGSLYDPFKGSSFSVCALKGTGQTCAKNAECDSGICSMPAGVCDPGTLGPGICCYATSQCAPGRVCVVDSTSVCHGRCDSYA